MPTFQIEGNSLFMHMGQLKFINIHKGSWKIAHTHRDSDDNVVIGKEI